MVSTEKYKVGAKLSFCDPQSGESFGGKVVENYKFPGDICIDWETGMQSSYDEDWLDQFTIILKD